MYTSSEAANILGFKNTYLEQNGIKTSIVDDGGKPSTIASLIPDCKTKIELSVRIVSEFLVLFENMSILMIMAGYAIIGFATSRELSSSGNRMNSGHLQDTSTMKIHS